VRLREPDAACISCSRKTGAKMNAGHYLSVGSHPELRFETGSETSISNIYPQCEHCNRWKSGAQQQFRAALVERYGEGAVDKLEQQRPALRLDLDQLKSLKIEYKEKIKSINANSS
jgi:hypothetical protein